MKVLPVQPYLGPDGDAEAFQLTVEAALAVLRREALLPWGLQYGSADWHPDRGTVSSFTVPVTPNYRARLGNWVVRIRGELDSYPDDVFREAFTPGSHISDLKSAIHQLWAVTTGERFDTKEIDRLFAKYPEFYPH